MSKYRAAALWKRYKIADRAEKSGRELWQGDFWAGAEPKDVQELPERVKAFPAAHSPTVVKNDITAVMTGRDRVHWYLDQLAAFEYCPLPDSDCQYLVNGECEVPDDMLHKRVKCWRRACTAAILLNRAGTTGDERE